MTAGLRIANKLWLPRYLVIMAIKSKVLCFVLEIKVEICLPSDVLLIPPKLFIYIGIIFIADSTDTYT